MSDDDVKGCAPRTDAEWAELKRDERERREAEERTGANRVPRYIASATSLIIQARAAHLDMHWRRGLTRASCTSCARLDAALIALDCAFVAVDIDSAKDAGQ